MKDLNRLKKEYNKRLVEYEVNEAQKCDSTGLEKQFNKLKQGISRLIDSYAEGLIEREEFEPKIKNLKSRITQLEAQLTAVNSMKTAQHELSLIIN